MEIRSLFLLFAVSYSNCVQIHGRPAISQTTNFHLTAGALFIRDCLLYLLFRCSCSNFFLPRVRAEGKTDKDPAACGPGTRSTVMQVMSCTPPFLPPHHFISHLLLSELRCEKRETCSPVRMCTQFQLWGRYSCAAVSPFDSGASHGVE